MLFLFSPQLIYIYRILTRFVYTFLWRYVDFSYNGDSRHNFSEAVALRHTITISGRSYLKMSATYSCYIV